MGESCDVEGCPEAAGVIGDIDGGTVEEEDAKYDSDEMSEGHWESESSGERRESLYSEDERVVECPSRVCIESRFGPFSTDL